jgi:hypothetical protein
MEIAAILPHIPPIGAAIAPVATDIALILPDVARFLPCRGRVTRSDILPALALVLPNLTPIAAYVTAVRPQVAPIPAHFVAISGGVAGLLRLSGHSDAQHQSQQRDDESPVLHCQSLDGLRVQVETTTGRAR